MYYLVGPPANLYWTDFDNRLIEKVVEEHSVDIGNLEWKPSEELSFTSDFLRAALAHGIRCSRGIGISPHYLHPLARPAQIERMAAEYEAFRPTVHDMDVQAARMMEVMHEAETGEKFDASGWVTEGDRLSEEISSNSRGSLDEATIKAAEILKAPARPELVEHWRSLGGTPV